MRGKSRIYTAREPLVVWHLTIFTKNLLVLFHFLVKIKVFLVKQNYSLKKVFILRRVVPWQFLEVPYGKSSLDPMVSAIALRLNLSDKAILDPA